MSFRFFGAIICFALFLNLIVNRQFSEIRLFGDFGALCSLMGRLNTKPLKWRLEALQTRQKILSCRRIVINVNTQIDRICEHAKIKLLFDLPLMYQKAQTPDQRCQ